MPNHNTIDRPRDAYEKFSPSGKPLHKSLETEGKFARFDPHSLDYMYIVSGEDSSGHSHEYIFTNGRYMQLREEGGQLTPIAYGAIGSDVRTDSPIQKMNHIALTIGGEFSDIARVERLEAIYDPSWEDTGMNPELEQRYEQYSQLMYEIGSQAHKDLFKRVGASAYWLADRAERMNYSIEQQPASPEVFDAGKALKLENLDSNLFITPLDNFVAPSSRVLTQKIKPPRELNAYYKQEQLIKTRTKTNFLTQQKTEKKRQDDPQYNQKIRDMITTFMDSDPRAVGIHTALRIKERSSMDLSPKQTIELLGHIIYETTNYDNSDSGEIGFADDQDAYSILRNGISGQHYKREVQPLGVCRNYADTMRAAFEAIKEVNPKLQNVYCFSRIGYGGASGGKLDKMAGHAWLDFVMVASEKNILVTTVDPTNTLKQFNGDLTRFDRTEGSEGTHMRTLHAFEPANYSTKKDRNVERIKVAFEERMQKRIKYLAKNPDHRRDGVFRLDYVPRSNHTLQKLIFDAVEQKLTSLNLNRGLLWDDKQNDVIERLISYGGDLDPRPMTKSEKLVILQQLYANYKKESDDTKKLDVRKKMKKFYDQIQSAQLRPTVVDTANEGNVTFASYPLLIRELREFFSS